VSVNFTPRPLYLLGKKWVEPRVGWDAMKKRNPVILPGIELQPSRPSLVSTLTELSRSFKQFIIFKYDQKNRFGGKTVNLMHN
jgi:hypothetical protein